MKVRCRKVAVPFKLSTRGINIYCTNSIHWKKIKKTFFGRGKQGTQGKYTAFPFSFLQGVYITFINGKNKK